MLHTDSVRDDADDASAAGSSSADSDESFLTILEAAVPTL